MDEDDPSDRLPKYERTELTPDQIAMLELLGNPEIVGMSSIALYHERRASELVPEATVEAHAMTYACPVVEVLGRRRAILPNGDLRSQG